MGIHDGFAISIRVSKIIFIQIHIAVQRIHDDGFVGTQLDAELGFTD